VLRKDERFLRFTITEADVTLRIELINDVPAHIGTIMEHPLLGRVDSPENILANKVTAAIDRNEPKDLALNAETKRSRRAMPVAH
jgi:protein gp37